MNNTKEFLISELHRFVRENGRNPVARDMKFKFGYPDIKTYIRIFGTFNSALTEAGLEINKKHHISELDGTETCNNCGCSKEETLSWRYEGNTRLCHRCFKDKGYRYGNLNPNSEVGFAFICQRVVMQVLNLEDKYDCNLSNGFNSAQDIYDKNRYNYINVKGSELNRHNEWQFRVDSKHMPDTYIFLGFSYYKKNILRVWITDPLDDLTYERKGISIKNEYLSGVRGGLTRAEPWEVDVRPYNEAYHSMSLDKCEYLRSD